MKRLLLFLLMAAALLSACGTSVSEEEGISIYYRSTEEEERSLLRGVPLAVDEEDYEAIFEALKTPPKEETLISHIPAGTTLESASLTGGVLYLEVSPEYSTLTGVDQTLANSCITLTYCQIPQVSGVSITSGGEPMSELTILTPAKLMLTGGGGDVGVVTAELYYPIKAGGIGFYTQNISVEENRTSAEAVLYQLSQTPSHRELVSFLPQELSDVTVWTEDDICYINLTARLAEELETGEVPLHQTLTCITNSICSLNSVQAVQFLQDGAVLDRWQEIGGDFPILENREGCVDLEELSDSPEPAPTADD